MSDAAKSADMTINRIIVGRIDEQQAGRPVGAKTRDILSRASVTAQQEMRSRCRRWPARVATGPGTAG